MHINHNFLERKMSGWRRQHIMSLRGHASYSSIAADIVMNNFKNIFAPSLISSLGIVFPFVCDQKIIIKLELTRSHDVKAKTVHFFSATTR
jgi:hypothetical protein